MSDEIDIVSNEDGIFLFGPSSAVERAAQHFGGRSQEIDTTKITRVMGIAGTVVEAAGAVTANAGRWLQMTEGSAAQFAEASSMMTGSSTGVFRAIVTENNKTAHILEFTKNGLTNPAVLSGIGGLMAQAAMQQAMAEITDYLEKIDLKLDDVLRTQKDAAIAQLHAAGIVISEALVQRENLGTIPNRTWIKVAGTATDIAGAQVFALRQLKGIADKVESKSAVGDILTALEHARREIPEWLAVLAQSVQFEEGLGVLEMDRVLEESPQEIDAHQTQLRLQRSTRSSRLAEETNSILQRLGAVALGANSKILRAPVKGAKPVPLANAISLSVSQFQGAVGVTPEHTELSALEWKEAAADALDKADELRGKVVERIDQARDAIAEKGIDGMRDAIVDGGAAGVEAAAKVGKSALRKAQQGISLFADVIADGKKRIAERKGSDET